MYELMFLQFQVYTYLRNLIFEVNSSLKSQETNLVSLPGSSISFHFKDTRVKLITI